MRPYQTLSFATAGEWRQWLERNHDKEDGVWLVHYNRASGKGGLTHTDAVAEALCFGWIDSILRKVDADSFALKYTPRRQNSVWSKINRDKAEQLIREGRMTAAGLAKIEEARRNGLWDNAYTNRKRERMPADLKNALRENRDAWRNFQQFANSYRNMYIGWVSGAKTGITRTRRIAEVVRRAALNQKPGIS